MAESFYIDMLANAGVEITIAGQKVRVHQLTLRDQGRLQSVIRSVQPHPVTEAKSLNELIDDQTIRTENLRQAVKLAAYWPSAVASDEGLQILLSRIEGQTMLLECVLRISPEEAEKLTGELQIKDFMRIAATALSGVDPDTQVEIPGDDSPKAAPAN
jgi:hypothetical protein